MFRRTLFASAALVAATLAAGSAQAQLKIAAAGPMTGEYAAFGSQMKAGAQQAVEDINAAGGVLGQTLDLEVGDDACDPRQAVSAANKLASDGVKFVAGHYCSGSSIPASKVYADEGVLEISPASTNPDYTDKGAWNTFRVCGRDDQQGAIAGKYLAEHYKNDKVAILDDNSAYGKGLADQTRKAFQAAGGKEVLDEHYVAGEKDYSALVSRMKQAGVQVAYIGGYHTEAGLIVRQAHDQGMNAQFISGDAQATDEFGQIAGTAGDGFMFTFPPDPRNNPGAAKVVAEFKQKGIDPEGYTLYTYAAVQIWAEAAKKANSTDPQKIAAELKKDGPWDSVIGQIGFDSKGDVTKPAYVFYKWKDGKYTQMTQAGT
jgi:branched-chain amino acid transport system substrate-binding protein